MSPGEKLFIPCRVTTKAESVQSALDCEYAGTQWLTVESRHLTSGAGTAHAHAKISSTRTILRYCPRHEQRVLQADARLSLQHRPASSAKPWHSASTGGACGSGSLTLRLLLRPLLAVQPDLADITEPSGIAAYPARSPRSPPALDRVKAVRAICSA